MKPVPKPERVGGKTNKDSGTYFERQAAKYFNNEVCHAKRIAGSGAFGKLSRDPTMLGDVEISFRVLREPILADCKFGYSRGKQSLRLEKEWFDKIAEEAALTRRYPAVLVRFKGQQGENAKIIAFTWQTFKQMMSDLTKTFDFLTDGGSL